MAAFVISYDLRAPGRDYSKLYDAIKSYGTWAHTLESDWCIVTNRTAVEVRDHLLGFIDANDRLTVITASLVRAESGDQRLAQDELALT